MLTISSPNTDRLLLTSAELAAVVAESVAKSPQALSALNRRVSAMITAACRVASAGATPPTLRLESVSETFRLKSQQECLVLARRPVVAIISVTENDTVLVADDDYEVDTSAGLLYRLWEGVRACWPCGTIVVPYSAGWQTVPYDLRELACKLATVLSAETGRDPSLGSMDIPRVIAETYRYGRPDDPLIPAEIMEGLERGGYVNYFVA